MYYILYNTYKLKIIYKFIAMYFIQYLKKEYE
jgi:hypothetical protein